MPFIDLHIHTNHSDGSNSIESTLKKAKKLNIGIAITDHNTISGAIKASKQKEVIAIPGIEVGTIENRHVNLLFYNIKELEEFHNKEIEKNKISNKIFNWWQTKLSTETLIDVAKKYNCLIVAPHPYNRVLKNKNWSKKIKNLSKIDAVEVMNSAIHQVDNRIANQFAEDINKSKVGGSDAHCLHHIGKAGILTIANNIEEVLNNIKKGKIQVKGDSYKIPEKLRHYKTIVKKNILMTNLF